MVMIRTTILAIALTLASCDAQKLHTPPQPQPQTLGVATPPQQEVCYNQYRVVILKNGNSMVQSRGGDADWANSPTVDDVAGETIKGKIKFAKEYDCRNTQVARIVSQ